MCCATLLNCLTRCFPWHAGTHVTPGIEPSDIGGEACDEDEGAEAGALETTVPPMRLDDNLAIALLSLPVADRVAAIKVWFTDRQNEHPMHLAVIT